MLWWDVDGLSLRSLFLKVGPTGPQHRDVETEAAGTREMGGAEPDQAPCPPPPTWVLCKHPWGRGFQAPLAPSLSVALGRPHTCDGSCM